MLPTELAKSDTEHAHQRAFFQWINFASRYGFTYAKDISLGERTVKWVADNDDGRHTYPELALMHAIPNGGYRRGSEASKLKAEGVKSGVLDTFLPVPKEYTVPGEGAADGQAWKAWYMGLYVEFKEPKRRNHAEGGMSDAQVEFADAVRAQGYCARVAYTWYEAANVVMLYYGVDTRFEAS